MFWQISGGNNIKGKKKDPEVPETRNLEKTVVLWILFGYIS